MRSLSDSCIIRAVASGDGSNRDWCLRHGHEARLQRGARVRRCRQSDSAPPLIDLGLYPGGVGIWGAVPPVFDTTTQPVDRGIHVHAREFSKSEKLIDATYRAVNVHLGDISFGIDELAAVHFMACGVFGISPEFITCTHCGAPHLDRGQLSLYPHLRHVCEACGHGFNSPYRTVGNPVIRANMLATRRSVPKPSKRRLALKQRDYPGGIRIWGSNPAIVWTGKAAERIGIHIHAYKDEGDRPAVDDTFAAVMIDGVSLDQEAIRLFMAQSALPELFATVTSLKCSNCGTQCFDRNGDAYTPRARRECAACSVIVRTGSLRRVVANPFARTLDDLAANAVRTPREYDNSWMLSDSGLGIWRRNSRQANDATQDSGSGRKNRPERKRGIARPVARTGIEREAAASREAATRARVIDATKEEKKKKRRHAG